MPGSAPATATKCGPAIALPQSFNAVIYLMQVIASALHGSRPDARVKNGAKPTAARQSTPPWGAIPDHISQFIFG